MSKKSQSAIEFVILVGVMLFIFLAYSYVFQQNTGEKMREKRILIVQDLALTIQNEIDLATTSRDGYERTFDVPEKLLNIGYNVSLVGGFVYVVTEDGLNALALPVRNVTGGIVKGENVIRKVDGAVLLN